MPPLIEKHQITIGLVALLSVVGVVFGFGKYVGGIERDTQENKQEIAAHVESCNKKEEVQRKESERVIRMEADVANIKDDVQDVKDDMREVKSAVQEILQRMAGGEKRK